MSKKPKNVPFSLLVFKSIKVIACSALFIALSIICGKYLAIPVGQILRFSFENLPIILSGILFGPLMGAVVGILADLLGCILVGYAINPMVMAGACSIGVLSGLVSVAAKRASLCTRIASAVAASHLVGSVVLKTIGLARWYDFPFVELMLWRLLNYVIIGIVEYLLIYTLLKNKAVKAQIDSILYN